MANWYPASAIGWTRLRSSVSQGSTGGWSSRSGGADFRWRSRNSPGTATVRLSNSKMPGIDRQTALEDDVDPISRLALAHEDTSGLQLNRLHRPSDRFERLGVGAREYRARIEAAVAGAGPSSVGHDMILGPPEPGEPDAFLSHQPAGRARRSRPRWQLGPTVRPREVRPPRLPVSVERGGSARAMPREWPPQ